MSNPFEIGDLCEYFEGIFDFESFEFVSLEEFIQFDFEFEVHVGDEFMFLADLFPRESFGYFFKFVFELLGIG